MERNESVLAAWLADVGGGNGLEPIHKKMTMSLEFFSARST
jgi:hypothetical protein